MSDTSDFFVSSNSTFDGSSFAIHNISELLPKHKNFPRGAYTVVKPWNQKPAIRGAYYEDKNRIISKAYVHQTGGSGKPDGISGAIATARFATNDPSWSNKNGKWLWRGTGRGWPGMPYTFYLPYKPHIRSDGKVIIFQCWDLDWITWHSSDNANSIAIACQGYFNSHHIKNFIPKKSCPNGTPSTVQIEVVYAFLQEYVIAHLNIKPNEIRGHSKAPTPKLTCPGLDLEAVIKKVQKANALDLESWAKRKAALHLLGHFISDSTYSVRLAIEYQENIYKLKQDGYWDDTFDKEIKKDLAEKGIKQELINNIANAFELED